MSQNAWLPPLLLFEDSHGNWRAYLDRLYKAFSADFLQNPPSWPQKRFALKRHPEYDGKSATFWHFISTGRIEVARIPDLRRCERIAWAKPIIQSFNGKAPVAGDRIIWWKNTRGNSVRIVLALRDFSYVVIIEDRTDFVLPWTAYFVEWTHQRQKLEKEYKEYWGAQKC